VFWGPYISRETLFTLCARSVIKVIEIEEEIEETSPLTM
jgi:hypothetical protein